jgi:hypothetical protein
MESEARLARGVAALGRMLAARLEASPRAAAAVHV